MSEVHVMARDGWFSLREIEAVQGLGGDSRSAYEQCADYGVGDREALFRVAAVPMPEVRTWEPWLDGEDDDYIGELAEAFAGSSPPPPIIAIRETDGTFHPVDGFHRVRAAMQADIVAIAAWVAREQPAD